MDTDEPDSGGRGEVHDRAREDVRDRELEDLRWDWDEAYQIGWQDGRFRAGRLDGRGSVEAGTPQELRDLIRADYAERPVPRRYGGDADASVS